jgi:hypothetical protein
MEVQDWEGEHRNPDNDTPPDDFRPHGEEW